MSAGKPTEENVPAVNVPASTERANAAPEVRYNAAEIEPRWQERWASDPKLYAAEPPTSGKPKYYVLEMLPYPIGAAAHGARSQLLHWRRAGPLQVDGGRNVLHPDGVGRVRASGGECGAEKQHASARMDALEHRGHAAADAAPGPELRLADGDCHLPAGILPLEPVVLSEDV